MLIHICYITFFVCLIFFLYKYYLIVQENTYWVDRENDKFYVITDINNDEITLFLTNSKNVYIKVSRWKLHKNFIRVY